MKTVRERRDGWAAGRAFRLNWVRDPEILEAVGLSKVLSTRLLAELAFGSRETARDRLRKLHVAGLLRAHVRELAGDNLYTITEAGKELVLEQREVDADDIPILRALPKQIDHLLGVNVMRVFLTVASRSHPTEPLRAFVPDWRLLRSQHRTLAAIVPDAIVKLVGANGARHFVAIEVDLGAENPNVVAKKTVLYEQHARAGLEIFGAHVERMVIVAPGARRLRALARAIAAVNVHFPVLLGDLGRLASVNILRGYGTVDQVLATAGDEVVMSEELVPGL